MFTIILLWVVTALLWLGSLVLFVLFALTHSTKSASPSGDYAICGAITAAFAIAFTRFLAESVESSVPYELMGMIVLLLVVTFTHLFKRLMWLR
ncbi:hypothetical protein KKF55_03910 [Patescibacteria group bacterium]|nr:hypothetical protein [Patescibacteria group bacterium]